MTLAATVLLALIAIAAIVSLADGALRWIDAFTTARRATIQGD